MRHSSIRNANPRIRTRFLEIHNLVLDHLVTTRSFTGFYKCHIESEMLLYLQTAETVEAGIFHFHSCWRLDAVCSEGILAGEMKHGPLALVDEHLPILVVATCDTTRGKRQSVLEQLLARKGQVIVMCNSGDKVIKELCNYRGCQTIEVCSIWRIQRWFLLWISNANTTISEFAPVVISALIPNILSLIDV